VSPSNIPVFTTDPVVRGAPADTAALAARIDALEQARHGTDGGAGVELVTVADVQKNFDDLLASHAAEPVDRSWSSQGETNIAAELNRSSIKTILRGASIGAVECRTDTCTVDIEWRDYMTAMVSGKDLVHATFYSENCGAGILLTPPDNPQNPYRAKLLMNCRDARDGRAVEHLPEPTTGG
jgi:hypothetical protein